MNIVKLVCYLNKEDKFVCVKDAKRVDLWNKSQYSCTFWNTKVVQSYHRLPFFFSDEALDLLYLSNLVFFADRIISRSSFPDGWTRNIHLSMPVLSYDKWLSVKTLLEQILSFLSGDEWKIEFRKRTYNEIENEATRKWQKKKILKISYDAVCMLSGGLDSFIGAIDLIESNQRPLFVSHYGGGSATRPYQTRVKDILMNKYKLSNIDFFQFNSSVKSGIENTTRTRSFMFFAYAACLASSFRKPMKLYVPENGLISLNIPLAASRNGSSSTRTTHPYYIHQYSRLLKEVGLTVSFELPYKFLTKGEMFLNCKNRLLLNESYTSTMSCSHPEQGRHQGLPPTHCGSCYPCIIRRAAIKAAGLRDSTNYRDPWLSNGDVARQNMRVYKYALTKFKKIYHPSISVEQAGPLLSNVNDFTGVYVRGMNELDMLIGDIIGNA